MAIILPAMVNAVMAEEMAVTAVMWFERVRTAVKDHAREVRAHRFPHLGRLVNAFFFLGGNLMVCTPRLRTRSFVDDQFTKGTRVSAVGTVVDGAAS